MKGRGTECVPLDPATFAGPMFLRVAPVRPFHCCVLCHCTNVSCRIRPCPPDGHLSPFHFGSRVLTIGPSCHQLPTSRASNNSRELFSVRSLNSRSFWFCEPCNLLLQALNSDIIARKAATDHL